MEAVSALSVRDRERRGARDDSTLPGLIATTHHGVTAA